MKQKITVQLTFQIVEYHRFEREVDAKAFGKAEDKSSWLNEKFMDDAMSDSDINTDSCELSEWEVLEKKQDKDE